MPTIIYSPKEKSPKQKGATLLIGLIFLAIISLVSIYSMRTSSIQEKITSNQRNKTISLMAAEFGVNFITAKIENKECTLSNLSQCTVNTATRVGSIQNYNSYWMTAGNPVVTGTTIAFTVIGTSRDSDGVNVLGTTRIQFEIQVPVDAIAGRVIETAGNVEVRGRLKLGGGGHTNGNWDVTSGSNEVAQFGILSAKGTITVGGVPTDQLQPNNGETIALTTVENLYATELSGTFAPCNFTANQNLNGQVFRCSTVSFAGPVSNGTIVVNNSVTISRNRNLNGIKLISTGDISFDNNANDVIGTSTNPTILAAARDIIAPSIGTVYGEFIANRNVLFSGNGNTTINGYIRAGGSITSNGGLEVLLPAGNPPTPAIPTSIKKWQEVI